jgi:antagonist of KipI
MPLLVHSAGTQSLLVDLGRPGWRSLGVPLGGAADRTAFALGNALVGNESKAVALEFALAGPTLEATAEHGCVIFGAGFQAHINDRLQPVGKTFTLRLGQVLTIGTTETGLRGYLCVAGGFDVPEVLGSRSGLEPIRGGQQLDCRPSALLSRFWRPDDSPPDEPRLLRVLPGTHIEQFDKARWIGQEYTVAPDSNRMGLRLQGEPLTRPEGELVSAPVTPGTVQVTNDGQTIVLGVDAQTIGGYPRLAHVIAADVDKLAQLRPGERIRFEFITVEQAATLFRAKQVWLKRTALRLRSSLLR